MSVGESAGGLPPDSLVEPEPAILDDMIRVVDAFHDPLARRDGPGRPRALLALLGLDRADARRRRARPRQGRDAPHPPRRERRGHRLFARAVRLPPRPVRRGPRLDRRPRLARALREARRRRDRPLRPQPAPASRTAPARTAGSAPASRRSGRCATPACTSALGVDGSASNDAGHLLAEARHGDAPAAGTRTAPTR